MTSAVPATRNKLKINRHRDAVFPQNHSHTTISPGWSPQFTFRYLVDSESPSSSANKDDPSDTNADKSEGQEPSGCATASSSMDTLGTDLDLSVIIPLIAPLVDWLTGCDYLENLFLVLFLIVYQHQLVQVPWELYNASRRRRPHPSIRPLDLQENEEAAIKTQTERAETELRRQEFGYLFLSIVTPFAGAALLRFVLSSVNGADSISWFSTTLFVLAAGVRPWSHLTSRLREHTSSLHDSIHYPSPDSQFIADSRLQVILDRVNNLERELSAVKRTMETHSYVDDIQDTGRMIRNKERTAGSARDSYGTWRSPTRLSGWFEAIEEDVMEEPNTDWNDQNSNSGQSDDEASCQSDPNYVGVSRRSHRQSPRNMTKDVIANVVSLPYRLSASILVGIIVAVAPPLQHFFH